MATLVLASAAVQLTAPETFWFWPSTMTAVGPALADPDVDEVFVELVPEHPLIAATAMAAPAIPTITTRVTMSSPLSEIHLGRTFRAGLG
jgi:hypothetical protein